MRDLQAVPSLNTTSSERFIVQRLSTNTKEQIESYPVNNLKLTMLNLKFPGTAKYDQS